MKMIFLGRKLYAAKMLEWSIGQEIEVVAVCTDTETMENPVVRTAEKYKVPVVSLERAEIISTDQAIDVAVSYLYSRKIHKPLIENPINGCINFHPAILPDWRGTAGYNLAIYEKLSEWGATAHYINEDIDMGEIIRIFKFAFDYRNETAVSLERKTQNIQMDLYKSVMMDVLEHGKIDSHPQVAEEGRYISRAEMEKLKEIDPDRDDIDLKIKAFWFPPYNGAYIKINGKKYTLINDDILSGIGKLKSVQDNLEFFGGV